MAARSKELQDTTLEDFTLVFIENKYYENFIQT